MEHGLVGLLGIVVLAMRTVNLIASLILAQLDSMYLGLIYVGAP